ncbi:MAG TPA: 2-hydroxyacyl-CoA dehydratase, partial [Firmicutes bacterium]|nr:2-hydroxyacyl-CoA dehydratase [Bacillota bacterium]
LNVPRLAGGHEDHTAGGAGAVKGKEAGGVGAAGVEIRLEAGAEAEASAGAGIGAGELVLEFWERELRRLMEALSSRFGAVFTEEGLFKAIETCNETRELLYSVYRLNSYYGYFDSSFPGSSSSSRSSESPGYFESPGSFASSGSFGSSGSSGFSGPPGYPGDPDSPGPGCGDGAVSAAAISGVDVIKIVKMSMSYPKSRFNAALKGLLARFSCPRERPREATGRQSGPHSSHSRPRILVAGSVCDVPVLEIIEDAGARVVADDLCVGMRYVLDRVDMDEAKRGGNLVRAIAKRYLNKVPCARMHHAASRFERVSKLAREFDVDGVIFYGLKFCDPYLYDHVTLRRALEANGIPVLFLEGDYTAGGAGQARTRVEAFVEMIGS